MVLFGEIRSSNLFLPKFLPIKNAKESFTQISIKTPKIVVFI